jgi:hypothetical protein
MNPLVNLVEALFGIAIGTGLFALWAFVKAKRKTDRASHYRMRARSACLIGCVALGLAVIGEILLHV